MTQRGMQQSARRLPAGLKPGGSPIPDKLYFRIGEVSKLCAVPAYVLRFWETEFPQLHPNKGGTGQRLYRRRDVEMALSIRTLLYEEGFTIAGARQALKAEQRHPEPQLALAIVDNGQGIDRHALGRLRKEMQALLELLSEPPAPPARRKVHPISPRVPKAVPPKAESDVLFP